MASFTQRTITGEKHLPCNQWPKSFSASKNLNNHRRIITGQKQNSAKVILYSFIKRILTGEKYFPCDQCLMSFLVNNDLKKHRRIHIQGNKKNTYCLKTKKVNKIKSIISCSCPNLFSTSNGLQKHRGTHIGEKQITKIFNIFFKSNNVPFQQEDNTSNSKSNSVALLGNSRKN